jgi:uncharacterized protein YbjQ (UPF0145 family)
VEPSETAGHAIDALRSRQRDPKGQATGGHHALGKAASVEVDTMLALETVGYEPVGLVTGSSAYEIPLLGRWANYKQNAEVEVFTHGLQQARLSSLERMRRAAVALGADGIVDIKFELPRIPKDGNEVRFNAAGLAIRTGPNSLLQPRKDSLQNPFTTTLDGHDFALLVRAGYLVVGVVVGVCVFHVGRRDMAATLKSLPRNTELTVITEALYQSRELAMARMQEEAFALDTDGVLGARVDEHTHAWGSRVIEFVAVGTGIELVADQHQPLRPSVVLSLTEDDPSDNQGPEESPGTT